MWVECDNGMYLDTSEVICLLFSKDDDQWTIHLSGGQIVLAPEATVKWLKEILKPISLKDYVRNQR